MDDQKHQPGTWGSQLQLTDLPQPVEILSPEQAERVCGGLELRPARVTSYPLSGPTDAPPDLSYVNGFVSRFSQGGRD